MSRRERQTILAKGQKLFFLTQLMLVAERSVSVAERTSDGGRDGDVIGQNSVSSDGETNQ